MRGGREGSKTEIVSRGDQLVSRKKAPDLTGMVARVTVDNPHPEVDTGAARGNEEW